MFPQERIAYELGMSQKPGILKNRALQITEAAKSCPKKAHRRGQRRCDMEVSAAPANAPSEAAE